MTRRVEADYDVLVCGGGAAGVGAAIGAAKAGAKTCLVEKYGFLGGAATTSQVLAYCGMFQQGSTPVPVVDGVGNDVLEELKSRGLEAGAYRSETTGNWIVLLEPEILKFCLDQLLIRHGVDVRLHTRLASVSRTDQRIEAVTLAGMAGRDNIVSEAFVDASGDANLAMLAGIDCRVGDIDGKLQALTLPIRIGGLDAKQQIDRTAMQRAIEKYNIQGRFPIKRTDAGIYTRLPLSRDLWWMVVDLTIDDLSASSFTRAEMTAREMAHDYLAMLKSHVSGFEQAHIVATGPQIGVRESRHPSARYEISGDDIISGRQRDDSVARAGWPIELHEEAGKPTYTGIGGDGYFSIPYDAIRADRLENLWYGGRVIGADAVAYGSIRVMGTAFATGEAAGVAAADYCDQNHKIDVRSVRKRLTEQAALV